jgi:hypothetical protein
MDMETVVGFLKATCNNKAFASWVAQRRIDELYRESNKNSGAVVPSLTNVTPKGPKKEKRIGSGEQKPVPVHLTQNDERKIAAKKKKEELFKAIEDEKNSKTEFSQTFGYEKPIYGTTLRTVMVPKQFEYERYYKGCGGVPAIETYTKRVPEKRECRIVISRKWIPADTKYWYKDWKEDYGFIKKYGNSYNIEKLRPWNLLETKERVENDLDARRKQAEEYDRKKKAEQNRLEIEQRRIVYQEEIDKFVSEEKNSIMEIPGMMNFITSRKWQIEENNKFGLNTLTLGWIMMATNASVTGSDPTCITSSHSD